MDLLGGYASSDDEISNEQATTAAAPASTASATPASAHAPSADAAASAAPLHDMMERKRLKQEKRERKAAKLAAAASSVTVTDAPLPAPKLILPSASSALSAQSSRAPTFLSLQAADRAREALQLAEQSGSVVARSVPGGLHAEAAQRNLAAEQAREAQQAATEAILSVTERESKSAKRKLLQNAQARMADGEASPAQIAAAYAASSAGKKQRVPDGTGGPARASDQVKDKEKLKRGKGQSGIESGWKPEAWMQNRQNYDS